MNCLCAAASDRLQINSCHRLSSGIEDVTPEAQFAELRSPARLDIEPSEDPLGNAQHLISRASENRDAPQIQTTRNRLPARLSNFPKVRKADPNKPNPQELSRDSLSLANYVAPQLETNIQEFL